MKIGILTFHCAHNYGAVLQCYALQEVLKRMGHEVEVIDYRPKYLLQPYKVFDTSRFVSKKGMKLIKAIIKEFLLLNKRIGRYNAFRCFIKRRLNLSSKVIDKNIPSKYDAYIFGSDQIWNTQITHGDSIFFGNFPFEKGNKRYVAYAASTGLEDIFLRGSMVDSYRQLLHNFDFISVRENQTISQLQSLTDKRIELVLDPTLLLSAQSWDAIVERPRINKKYVLIYQVRIDKNISVIANRIAKEIGAIVVEVSAWLQPFHGSNVYQCETPEEFIGWIKHSACVVTTSFHGTVFSLIYNCPFYYVDFENSKDYRVKSLLSELKLENRIILGNEKEKFFPLEIEYNTLFYKQKKSIAFLEKALR